MGLMTATSDGDIDTISGFESYILSNQNDIVTTSSDVDTVDGGGGSDIFYASVGSDIFDGGDDLDVIDYSTRGGSAFYVVADFD
ncbi:MAG: hypothetical protein EOM23_08560, partial [Candidatus Moranbacteria bacterium]|nr:hypothetical protein [Candidatus Moranbacteria bacterium]